MVYWMRLGGSLLLMLAFVKCVSHCSRQQHERCPICILFVLYFAPSIVLTVFSLSGHSCINAETQAVFAAFCGTGGENEVFHQNSLCSFYLQGKLLALAGVSYAVFNKSVTPVLAKSYKMRIK